MPPLPEPEAAAASPPRQTGAGIRERLEREKRMEDDREKHMSKLDPHREGAFYTLGVPDLADVTEMDDRIANTLEGTCGWRD